MMTSHITFQDMDGSDAARALIEKRIAKLARLHGRAVACHVVVQAPRRHMRKGKLYAVSIDLILPRGEIAVSHDKREADSHSELRVAIRDAFDAMERQLKRAAMIQRGDVKTHRQAPRAKAGLPAQAEG